VAAIGNAGANVTARVDHGAAAGGSLEMDGPNF